MQAGAAENMCIEYLPAAEAEMRPTETENAVVAAPVAATQIDVDAYANADIDLVDYSNIDVETMMKTIDNVVPATNETGNFSYFQNECILIAIEIEIEIQIQNLNANICMRI